MLVHRACVCALVALVQVRCGTERSLVASLLAWALQCTLSKRVACRSSNL